MEREEEFGRLTVIEVPGASTRFHSALNNPLRNRWVNALPFQSTRFTIAGEPGYYINASMVQGGKGIASQGPLPNEHAEFWKMVWHSGTPALVMLTNLVEQGFVKCSCYWPAEAPLLFENGAFTVSPYP